MKICSKCKQEKELDLYYNNKNKIDGKSPICKNCQKIWDSKHYLNNKEKHKINSNKTRKIKEEWFKSLKYGKKCIKCNDQRWYVLDYHHLDPDNKKFHLADFLHYKKDLIIKEIEKCILICRNCHSEFHFLEKQNKITINDYINIM